MSDAAVVEFVVGVGFRPLPSLTSAHIGAFWTTIKDEFPNPSDANPSPPPDVQLNLGRNEGFAIRGGGPAEIRQRFASSDGTYILQIQNGWMFINWVNRAADAQYPGYHEVIQLLSQNLARFEEYCSQESLGKITAQMCELQYVNELSTDSLIAKQFLNGTEDIKTPSSVSVSGFSANLEFHSPGFPGVLTAAPRQLVKRQTSERVVVCEVKAVSGGLGEKESLGTANDQRIWDWFDVAHSATCSVYMKLLGRPVEITGWTP